MIKFNKNNGTIEPFTIILTNRNQEYLGEIVNTEAVNFTGNLNAADELSFNVNKMKDGVQERLWDEIYDLRLVYIKELNEYFEINVSFTDQTYLVKTITAKSLCEAELSQTMLYGIEINTEIDIERDDYKVAKFWTNNTDPQSEEYKSTILYRVLEKVPAYKVKHVDSTLIDLQRVIKIDGKSVYDWLVNDCATEFNCLVKFDTTDRTISFYDLYTTCPICHSRGIYNDSCTHIITEDDLRKYGINGQMPNGVGLGGVCGNTNLGYYGEDTTILVSTENLTDEIKYDTDVDSIKNSFRLEAGDDDMTAALVNINPNGSQYIYNYSPESLRDMPPELVDAINDYNTLYNQYKYTIPNYINGYLAYNSLVDKYASMYAAFHNNEEQLVPLPYPIIGYTKLMEFIYQGMDFYSYLESSMMPKLDFPTPTAATEAAKITSGIGSYVALSTFSSRTQVETVESALVNYAKALVYTGFVNVSVDTTSYTPGNLQGVWVGRFIVKNNSLEDTDIDKTAYAPSSGTMTIIVNGDYDTYIVQKIRKKIAKDEEAGLNLYSLFMEPSLAVFKTEIKKYSLNRLRSFKDSLDAVLGVLQEAGIALDPNDECLACGYKGRFIRPLSGDVKCPRCNSTWVRLSAQTDSTKILLYDQYYLPFLRKYQACEQEHDLRASELHTVAEYQDGIMIRGTLYTLLERKEEINDILDFKKFLDERSEEYNMGLITIATPIMTSNTTPSGYVASASSNAGNPYQPYYAFNRQLGYDANTWATTYSLPQWIQMKFPSAVCIRKVVTYNRNEDSGYRNNRAVSSFILQGSNNGSSWTNIQTCNIASSASHYKATFDINNVNTYQYYRLYVTGNFNNATGTGCGFADIELYKLDVDAQIDFYKLLTTYTRQDTYSNSNYISTSLNNADLFTMAQMFYDAAYEELAKASIYQHSISADLYNLLAIEEFQPLRDHFELGNWLRMATDDKLYRLRLISYSINFDDPTHLNTQFSDVTQTGDGYNDLTSLLNQAGSMATSYPAVERQAELGKLAKNGMDAWLKTGLDSTKTRIMNNDAEEIEITNVGITAKKYNDVTDSYDDEQLRITHNILAFTDDAWETVKTALGKFTFTHHEPHLTQRESVKQEEAYGLVAEAVLAGWVVGSVVEGSTIISGHIQNPSNTTYISLTDESWTEYNRKAYPYFIDANGNFQVTRNGNVKLKGGHISNPDDTAYIDLYPYQEYPDGSTIYYPYFLNVKNTFAVTKYDGTIISKGGHFQNWEDTSYIDLGNGSRYTIDSEGHMTPVTEPYFLKCTDPTTFSVSKAGYLISTSGQIGGFYISDSYISSTPTLSTSTGHHISLSTVAFTRNMYIPVTEYDSKNIPIGNSGMSNVNITDLHFAIGNYFGVSKTGSIYVNNVNMANLSCCDIICRKISAYDQVACHTDISAGGDISASGDVTGGSGEFARIVLDTGSYTDNGVTYPVATINVADHIALDDGLLINGALLIKEDAQGNPVIKRKIGSKFYQLYAIDYGTDPAPSNLPDGLIYLQTDI